MNSNQAVVWQAPHLQGTIFLRADFQRHAFDPHFHEEYAIGIIDSGCQSFTYDKGRRLDMPCGSVALIAPGVVHTGQGGWRYRMLYPSQSFVHGLAHDIFGAINIPTFHRPVVDDLRLFNLLGQLHNNAADPMASALEAQELSVAVVGQALRLHAGCPAPSAASRHAPAMNRIRELLNDRMQDSITLDQLSLSVGMSKFHLIRQFRSIYGLPPHAYLRLCRVKRARQIILNGADLSDTAVAVGFADQSHMTRAFRKTLGFTPGALLRTRS